MASNLDKSYQLKLKVNKIKFVADLHRLKDELQLDYGSPIEAERLICEICKNVIVNEDE